MSKASKTLADILTGRSDANIPANFQASQKPKRHEVPFMAATLRTIEATVSADGVVTTAEPIFGPCLAVITLPVDEKIPNAITRAAMDEPTEDLPCYHTMEDIRATLGI